MYTKTQWVDNTTPIDKNNLNKIESGIKNNDINIGEENYDNTKTYEVGDIVRYNEKIYKCITAITTAENFDISKWEQTNIVEIVQSEKSKIYELIEAISTPIVGEGENITLNDTAEKRFENFDIEGNHEQETRSGKNYLNTLAKYKAGDTVTIEGITYTFNDDGSITCNGTASANSILDISAGIQTINGTNKKIVGLLTGSQVPANVRLTAFTSDWGKNPIITFSEVNKSLALNMIENAEYTIFRLIIYSGTTVNNQTVYYQILDTSETDLTYEQYGVSPSPDYPSSIVAVGSNVNIFEATEKSFYSSVSGKYVEYLKDTNEYHITSTQTWYRNTLNNLKIGKEYTLSFEAKSSTVNSQMNGFLRIDKISDGTILKAFDTSVLTSAEYKRYSLTFIPTENSLHINIRNVNGIDAYIKNIKLVEGTETGEYSKYGQGCVKVTKCNKNILNIEDIDETEKSGIKYSVKNGVLRLNGTSTNTISINLLKNIKIKKGKYTHSASYIQLGLYISLDNIANTMISLQNGKKMTFELTEDKVYSKYFIWIDKGLVLNNVEIELQLEQGSTESSFEQHEE